jgi:hypothetical protein
MSHHLACIPVALFGQELSGCLLGEFGMGGRSDDYLADCGCLSPYIERQLDRPGEADWSCLGGPTELVNDLLSHPVLGSHARRVTIEQEDATPPGHTAI